MRSLYAPYTLRICSLYAPYVLPIRSLCATYALPFPLCALLVCSHYASKVHVKYFINAPQYDIEFVSAFITNFLNYKFSNFCFKTLHLDKSHFGAKGIGVNVVRAKVVAPFRPIFIFD